jgi:hypothetical protein
MITSIKPIDKSGYFIPWCRDPRLHEKLAWWATNGNQVLGVLIRDKIDHDFGWVVLTQQDQGDELDGRGAFRAVDLKVSRSDATTAQAELFAAMEQVQAALKELKL